MEMKLHHSVDESNFSYGQTGTDLGQGVLMVNVNNGGWGTVCSIGFNQAAADLVCSKIGFKRAIRYGPNLLDGTLTELEDKKIIVQERVDLKKSQQNSILLFNLFTGCHVLWWRTVTFRLWSGYCN